MDNKEKVRELRKYIKFRRENMGLNYLMVYVDLLMKIDSLFGKEKTS